MTEAATDDTDLLVLTAEIVAAHLEKNRVAASELPTFIASVHGALASLGKEELAPEQEPLKRPIGIRASIKPEGLVSMIDGKLYQSLKRHLGRHDHTLDSYRKAYDLPADYPMVSPAYSEKRSVLAKALGLGRKPKVPEAEPAKGRERGKLKLAIDAAKGHLGGS